MSEAQGWDRLLGTHPLPKCTPLRAQAASAVSISVASASTCKAKDRSKVQGAAYALINAATNDACSFASAVATVSVQGERAQLAWHASPAAGQHLV